MSFTCTQMRNNNGPKMIHEEHRIKRSIQKQYVSLFFWMKQTVV